MSAPLSPLEAYEQVMAFAAARGEDALRLAMHASVPQVFRPELLHLLKLNFVPESVDDPAIETDVLLASFCRPLGNGYYRFDAHARRHLVKQLDPPYRDEPVARSQRVASFLLTYFDNQRRVQAPLSDAVHAAYVEVERWVALAFFDSRSAARQLAAAVKQCSDAADPAARFRLTGLSDALSTPLAAHQSLLAYAAGVEAIERGDDKRAREMLGPLGDREIAAGEVTLPSARTLLGRLQSLDLRILPHGFEDPATDPDLAPDQSETVSEQTRDSIFISYGRKDQQWLDRLEPVLQPVAAAHGLDIRADRLADSGRDWRTRIDRAIERARVAILLVSADYLRSRFMLLNQIAALESNLPRGDLTLLWVPLEAAPFSTSVLRRYQAILDPREPLVTLDPAEQDRALERIATAVDKALTPNPPTPAFDIFLCYRRTDREWSRRLGESLKAAYGANRIFQDISSIEPGSDFLHVITGHARTTPVMLVVIGPAWLDRSHTGGRRRIDDAEDVMRVEVAAALRSRSTVVPVLVGGASMPRRSDLPSDLGDLALHNAAELRDESWDQDFARLRNALDQVLGDSTQSSALFDRHLQVSIEPTELFIVIQKDAVAPIFNMDARIGNHGRRVIVIHRLDVELTDPNQSSFRMRWNLFYNYPKPGLMDKMSDVGPLQLGAASSRSIGIQFVAPATVREFAWPAGEYRFDLLAWLSSTGEDERPDFARRSIISVDQQASRQVRRWATASDQQWSQLNDPHNAFGIKVTIVRTAR